MASIVAERPKRLPGVPVLTEEQRADCVARLLGGESARKLAREHGVSQQAMHALRDRAYLAGLKDKPLELSQGYARHPVVRAALDDRDAAATALAESAAALLATVAESLASGDVRRATGAYDSATRGLATIAAWRGWVQKPTNAAELQTSDALAAVVASWLSARDSVPALPATITIDNEEWQDEAPGAATGPSSKLSVE